MRPILALTGAAASAADVGCSRCPTRHARVRRTSRRSSRSTATTGRRSPRRMHAPAEPRPRSCELRGLGDPLDLARGRRGLPAAQPAAQPLRRRARGSCTSATSAFLGASGRAARPFVIGVAGSVAVGKSTVARLLRELLARWEDTPRVELVTTDGFLLPERRARAPRAHGAQGLPRVVRPPRAAALRQRGQERRRRGARAVLLAPRVRHRARRRDRRAPARRAHRRGPQRAAAADRGHGLAVSDLFDFTIYVDARTSDIDALVRGALPAPAARRVRQPATRTSTATRRSPRRRRATRARSIWRDDQRAEPARRTSCRPASRATLVLRKGADHAVSTACCCARSERGRVGSAAPRPAIGRSADAPSSQSRSDATARQAFVSPTSRARYDRCRERSAVDAGARTRSSVRRSRVRRRRRHRARSSRVQRRVSTARASAGSSRPRDSRHRRRSRASTNGRAASPARVRVEQAIRDAPPQDADQRVLVRAYLAVQRHRAARSWRGGLQTRGARARLGEPCGDRVGGVLVRRLDHDAHHRLGAGRAQQHAAGVAELGLRRGDGGRDDLVVGEPRGGRRRAR